VAALGDAEEVGLDTETTGLSHRMDRVRLLQLGVPTIEGGLFTYMIDLFAVPREALTPLLEVLAEKKLVGHNLAFDLSFLAPLGFTPGQVADTMTLSLLLDGPRKGKGYHGLAKVAGRELGASLDKEHQKSDWSAPELSAEQLQYAAADAAVLPPLHRALAAKVKASKQEQAADLESRCVPAMAWLSGSGAPFDRAAWEGLAAQARKDAEELADRLDSLAPQRDGYLPRPGMWKWNGPDDVQEVFKLLGIDLSDTTDDTLAGIDHPLARTLREYRSAAKLASTYGAGWLKGAYHQGRLYTEWKQMGCVTGRMASASPNLQNLPGDPRYRACFRAPEGRVLVKADYSQIELRITAKVTGDRRMLDAYANGEDLHTLTARQMTGRDEVSKEERKLAKPVNFGLIYGLSSSSLRKKAKAEYGLDLGPQDADRYRDAFFRTYPGVRAWHGRLRAETTTAVRTLAGRRCPLPEKHFYGTRANYTVQGTGGDGIKNPADRHGHGGPDCPPVRRGPAAAAGRAGGHERPAGRRVLVEAEDHQGVGRGVRRQPQQVGGVVQGRHQLPRQAGRPPVGGARRRCPRPGLLGSVHHVARARTAPHAARRRHGSLGPSRSRPRGGPGRVRGKPPRGI
jgi:DNA polymerase-1